MLPGSAAGRIADYQTAEKGATMTASDDRQVIPLPPPQLAELDYFRGTWDAEGIFHATPFSAQKPIRMLIEANLVYRGFWLQFNTAELADADNQNPLSATYVIGYDTGADAYQSIWFDSNGGRATQTSAGWNDGKLVLEGEMTAGGFTFPLRDTFVRRTDDEYYHLGEVDMGQGWIPADEETVRRR
jgi:hypothetical protein